MPMPPYAAKTAYQGAVASRYDEDRVDEPIWMQEQAFVEAWAETLPTAATVLDIPSGTGRFLPCLLAKGFRVHAIDISPDMVAEIFRRHAAAANCLSVAVGDAEQLTFPDKSVDYVLSWRFFHLLPIAVMHRVLTEFRRICRGTIVLEVLQAAPPGAGRKPWSGLKVKLLGWLRKWRGNSVLPWSHITSYSHGEAELRAAFLRAGLTVREAKMIGESAGQPVIVFFLESPVNTP